MKTPMRQVDEHDVVRNARICRELARRHTSASAARGANPVAIRQAASWCGVFAAIAATVLSTAGCGTATQSVPASVSAVRVPACASHEGAYLPIRPNAQASGAAPQPIPGIPVAAVVCRYAGTSGQPLSSSLKVTDQDRLTQLQSAMNESKANPPGDFTTCLQGDGESAVILVAYHGTSDRVAYLDVWCQRIATHSATYIPSVEVGSLIASWTGKW
jgi:hypothetical protein